MRSLPAAARVSGNRKSRCATSRELERSPVAGGVLAPAAIGRGLVQIQRVDEWIVLAQVDQARLVSAGLRSVTRTHQAECEKPTLALSGVRGHESRIGGAALTAAMSSLPPRSSSSSIDELSELDVHGFVADQRDDAGESPRTGSGQALTNRNASSQLHAMKYLQRARAGTQSPSCRLDVCLEYATVRAGSNAMRRLLKWIAACGARRGGRGGRLVRLVRVVAGAHAFPRSNRSMNTYGWTRAGARGRTPRCAQRYYYTRAGHFGAAGRLGRRGALRLVRESRAAAVAGALRRTRRTCASYRFLVDPEPSAANPAPAAHRLHAAFRSGASARTCSTSPARPATPAKSTTPRTARRARIRIDGGPAMHAFTDMQRGNFAPDAAGLADQHRRQSRGSSTASRRRCSARTTRDGKPQLSKALRATIFRPCSAAARTIRCASSTRCTRASAAPTRWAASATPLRRSPRRG